MGGGGGGGGVRTLFLPLYPSMYILYIMHADMIVYLNVSNVSIELKVIFC